MKSKINDLIITTGDQDGVGLEVAIKALRVIKKIYSHRLVLVLDHHGIKSLKGLRFNGKRPLVLADFVDLLSAPSDCGFVLMLRSDSPALWVEEAAKYCIKTGSTLCTGPISKTLIQNSGLSDMGHTGILKRVSGVKNIHMGFNGKYFNVVLATDHIPISKVPDLLSTRTIQSAINAALDFKQFLPASIKRKRIAVLGLNPHAGENGLIGDEESTTILRAIRKAANKNSTVVGPLVPDAAFRSFSSAKYSVFVALYHDQGLIPFKMAHGHDGAHVSLGLPFVRTSVDHGTAKEIFGKNVADPTSMVNAILLAIKIDTVKRQARRL